MVKAVESTDDYSSKDLTIRFYPAPEGKSSKSEMYEDDGKTFGSYEKGQYELLRFQNVSGKTFLFSRTGGQYEGMPLVRHVKFEIMTGKMPVKAEFILTESGNKYKIRHVRHKRTQGHKRTLAPVAHDAEWYYDKDRKCVVIDFVWRSKAVEISLK